MTVPLTKVHYLSVIPGAGKTFYILEKLERFIRNRSEDSGFCVYVAPTKLLLTEVESALKERLADDLSGPDLRKYLRVLTSSNQDTGDYNFSVASRLKALIKDSDRFCPGGVVLMTHEGFLSCHQFPHREVTQVYFDEARTFFIPILLKASTYAREPDTINLLEKLSAFILQNIKPFYPHVIKDGDTVESPSQSERYSIFRTTPELAKAFLASLTPGITYKSRMLMDTIQRLMHYAVNPRLELYVRKPSTLKSGAQSFHVFMAPSRVFSGFKAVLLVGAYLESSQMFHLLQMDPSIVMINVLSLPQLYSRFKPRVDTIRSSLYRIKYIALTPNNSVVSTRSFRTSVLVPRDKLLEYEEASMNNGWDELFVRNLRARLLRENYNGSLLETEEFQLALRSLSLSEKERGYLQFCIDNCVILTHLLPWMLGGAVQHLDSSGTALLSVNKSHQVETLEFLEQNNRRENIRLLSGTPQGINAYKTSNSIAYFSARNLPPATTDLLSVLIPEYDATEDHTANCAVQAITRTSIRDTRSKEAVLVMVPSLRTVSMLIAKLGLDYDACLTNIRTVKFGNGGNYVWTFPYARKHSDRASFVANVSSHPEYHALRKSVLTITRGLVRLHLSLKTATGTKASKVQDKIDVKTKELAAAKLEFERVRKEVKQAHLSV